MTKAMLSRVPEELHARVKQEANEQGTSMSKVVEAALEMYLSSVFLSVQQTKYTDYITFTIRESELHKLRSIEVVDDQFEEDDEARLSEG